MSIADALERLKSTGHHPDGTPSESQRPPAGWEPGIAWDGTNGTLTTGPMTGPPAAWADILKVWNLDPTEVEIVEPVQLRAWDAQTKEGIQRMFYYRVQIRRRREGLNLDELLETIAKWKPRKPVPQTTGGLAYLVNYADLQIGKIDGEGSAGTVHRVLEKTDAAAARLKELRKAGRQIDTVYLNWLGDCIEGFESQNGRLAWRTDLTLTEMVRVYRRLILHAVKVFAPLAGTVVVPVIPGNHDEAIRKVTTRADDSWAIDAASAVADALELAPEGYQHVSFVFPKKDELTITLDMAGTGVGLAHGHQFRAGKAHAWWADQAHGIQPIGDPFVKLLLTGHLHHLRVEQTGQRTWIQMPALDGGSQWWVNKRGQECPPGLVTLCTANGTWGDLAVL